MCVRRMSEQDQQKRARINFVVKPDQKQRWKRYTQEEGDEFQSLSQLVRRSVEKEINQSDSVIDTDSNGHTSKIPEIVEGLQDLTKAVEDLDTRLRSIEQAVRDDPEMRELANRVFELLPSQEELDEYESIVDEAGGKPPDSVRNRENSGRIEDLARAVGESDHRVRKALEKLQEDTHQVHTCERHGDVRFYKEG
jgi:hypothetical protein